MENEMLEKKNAQRLAVKCILSLTNEHKKDLEIEREKVSKYIIGEVSAVLENIKAQMSQEAYLALSDKLAELADKHKK